MCEAELCQQGIYNTLYETEMDGMEKSGMRVTTNEDYFWQLQEQLYSIYRNNVLKRSMKADINIK